MKNNANIQTTMEVFGQNPEKGFELLYKDYSGPIFRYLRSSFSLSKEQAEDILQDVFMPWVKSPEKYAKVENPSAYLFTSARNAALKFKGAKTENPAEVESSVNSHDTHIEANLMISDALSELPNEQKEAVILKVWISMTFEEIAKLQQCTLQTAASRYRYAIAKLKELIPWQK